MLDHPERATGRLFDVAWSYAYVMLHFPVLRNQTPSSSYGNEVTNVSYPATYLMLIPFFGDFF